MWNYVLASFAVFFTSLLCHYNFSRPVSFIDHPRTEYDYIVVGAGTSGCVVASRLSENTNVTVLLVEAGGQFGWLSTVPILAPLLQETEVDWAYETESQRYSSWGFWNYKQKWPRGKGLGGSGQINYLVHSFGRPEDYKEWPKGWSHADLLPYFKKVSDIMNVMSIPEEEYLANAFIMAEESLKLNNATLQKAKYTVKGGSRWSTFHAYLQNAWNRKKLHILQNTLVSKIFFKNSKADGIKVIYEDGSVGRINVKKEVILCAGSINTPQLLLLSGIGPAEHLEKFQIPVVRNHLEVGKNLFDHLNLPVYINLDARVSITLAKMQSVPEIFNYFAFGRGWFATNGVMGIGRANNSGIILFGMGTAEERILKKLANYHTEVFRAMFPSFNNSMHEGFIYLVCCLQPKSRGALILSSTDVRDQPRIDPSYLEHEDDVTCTHEAIKFALNTLDTKLFREYGARVHHPDLQECRHLRTDYWDRDYAECVMRTGAFTSYHPCGTCRMGADENAVVDAKLRVKGIDGLRIMDASILPSPISGNPNSVLIAMAERAVNLILERNVKD